MRAPVNMDLNRLAHKALSRLILAFIYALPFLVLGLIYGWATFGLGAP